MSDFEDSAWGQIRQGKSVLRPPHEQGLDDPAELDGDGFVGAQAPMFLVGYKSGARNDRFFTFQVPAKYTHLTDDLIKVNRKTILSVDVQRWRVYERAVRGEDPGQADGYLPPDA